MNDFTTLLVAVSAITLIFLAGGDSVFGGKGSVAVSLILGLTSLAYVAARLLGVAK